MRFAGCEDEFVGSHLFSYNCQKRCPFILGERNGIFFIIFESENAQEMLFQAVLN